MAGYTKLFSSILHSTIWQEDNETRLVWITMLAMVDKNGEVQASIPGLARAANVTVTECEAALKVLSSPDPYSRTEEHEGRRIEEVAGGWVLLNYSTYRQKMSEEERREYNRKKQAEYRARKKNGTKSVTDVSADVKHVNDMSITVNHNEQCVDMQKQMQRLDAAENEEEISSSSLASDRTSNPESNTTAQKEEEKPLISLAGFLKIAERTEEDESLHDQIKRFAEAIWIDMHEKGWKDSSGMPITSPSLLLSHLWRSEKVRTAKERESPSESNTEQAEAWKIQKDIERVEAEIKKLQDDPGNRNSALGAHCAIEEHVEKHRGEWLDFLRGIYPGAEAGYPEEWREFQDYAREMRENLQMQSGPKMEEALAVMDSEEWKLQTFVEFMPVDEPIRFEEWDQEHNATPWRDPKALTPTATQELKLLKQTLRRMNEQIKEISLNDDGHLPHIEGAARNTKNK